MAKVVNERVVGNVKSQTQSSPEPEKPAEDAPKAAPASPTGEGKPEPEAGVKSVPKPPQKPPRQAKTIIGKTGIRCGGWLLTKNGWRLK